MLSVTLLALVFVLPPNAGLLSSNPLSRHKRALARRADNELSRLAGEPCAVSGSGRPPQQQQQQQQTQASSPTQHRRSVASPRTNRRELPAATSAPVGCEGGCRVGAPVHRGASPRAGKERTSHTSQGDAHEDGGTRPWTDRQSRPSRASRFERGAPNEGNSSSPGSDSPGLRIPPKMQQDEGERASTSSPWAGNGDSTADVDPTARRSVGGASQWGKPVPKVPPSWMTSLYFSGRQEQLRLKPSAGVELPRDKFSLELWVNPEGGQSSPAVIAGVYDNCSRSQSEKGWSVGIRSLDPAGTKDARFYFTLRTDRALKATTVVTHQQYSANTWAHLIATYNSHNMTLYVDGAKVGESSFQSGHLYSPFMKTCRTFILGSNQSEQGQGFRGQVAGVHLWDYALSHEDLQMRPLLKTEPLLAMWADFTNVAISDPASPTYSSAAVKLKARGARIRPATSFYVARESKSALSTC